MDVRVVWERFLDALLAALVITSLALSSKVWFPTEQGLNSGEKAASVQTPPPAFERRMPDVLRPERIVVLRKDGMAADLQLGTGTFAYAWSLAQATLGRLRPTLSPATPESTADDKSERESLTLFMPVTSPLSDLATRWTWGTMSAANQSMRIDRISFEIGKGSGIFLAGPSSGNYRIGHLDESEVQTLQQLLGDLDRNLFYRPATLDVKELPIRLAPDLIVPSTRGMAVGRVRAQKPLESVEMARYFPDLSVIREIEEKAATSFTDGQRLLRLISDGTLEFRTPVAPGAAIDLSRALALANEWVGNHGGWPQDLVLGKFAQEPGKASLQFELRLPGPYPVETAIGAVELEMVSPDRVTYFRRVPDFIEVSFIRPQVMPIISPEEALTLVVNELPVFLFEMVRSIHPAYLLQPQPAADQEEWGLEPVWAITAGNMRVYVPAEKGLKQRPLIYTR